MSKGLSKYLNDIEFQINSLFESIDSTEVKQKGQPIVVQTEKNVYNGYKHNGRFFYESNDGTMKSVRLDKLKKSKVIEGVYQNKVEPKQNSAAIKSAVNMYLNQVARENSPDSNHIIDKCAKAFNIDREALKHELMEIGHLNESIEEPKVRREINFNDVTEFFKSADEETIQEFMNLCDNDKFEKAKDLVSTHVFSVDEEYATMDDEPEDYLDGQKFVG